MVLNNVKLLNKKDAVSIRINGTKITSVSNLQNTDDLFQLQFENALAFSGLINSHDHLDFNLFPMLGNKVYNNYTEWGKHIHANYKKEIAEVLKIPEALRVQWGIYKNLLCGVTTVVNHGKHLQIDEPLINVIHPKQNLHSVGFEKYWKLKLNDPFKKNMPCVIHAGEGTNEKSKSEIDKLIKWNFLKRELIAIHGVAMNEKQAEKFKALVWCPASNYFLLNKTAEIDKLKHHTKICFGTDSTLTSDWNIWEHIRMARATTLMNDEELFETINQTPTKIWNIIPTTIFAGNVADIVVARTKDNLFHSFYSINPEDILLVIQNGDIKLFDEEFFQQLSQGNFNIKNFSKFKINGKSKFVEGNLPSLMNKIKSFSQRITFPVCND